MTSPISRYPHLFWAWVLLFGSSLVACGGTRKLQVTSQPPGALVRLDEDVIGTTPLSYDFQHYGHRRLSLYLPGFRSYSEPIHLKTPWHARFPIDVFTEVVVPLGLRYEKKLHVTLEHDDGEEVWESLSSFVERADALRRGLPGQDPAGDKEASEEAPAAEGEAKPDAIPQP